MTMNFFKRKKVIINFADDQSTYQLLEKRRNFVLYREEIPYDYDRVKSIKFKKFIEFNSLSDFWVFFTKRHNWYMQYNFFIINEKERPNSLFEFILKTTNEIRLSQNFSFEEYEQIQEWDNLIFLYKKDDKISSDDFVQICSNCSKRIGYFSRYPKMICSDCRSNVTDKDKRRVVFRNTHWSGAGCQGYYTGQNEEIIYNSNICFIDDEIFFAEEARFGGIVIQKNE